MHHPVPSLCCVRSNSCTRTSGVSQEFIVFPGTSFSISSLELPSITSSVSGQKSWALQFTSRTKQWKERWMQKAKRFPHPQDSSSSQRVGWLPVHSVWAPASHCSCCSSSHRLVGFETGLRKCRRRKIREFLPLLPSICCFLPPSLTRRPWRPLSIPEAHSWVLDFSKFRPARTSCR